MSKEEKPLPKPPATPFGKKRRFEQEKDAPLTADRIAAAMAEGRLDEFLKTELPDSEDARKLVSIMMGMTGMMPPEGINVKLEKGMLKSEKGQEGISRKELSSSVQPPEDVVKAIKSGDVKGLVGLLEREYKKRMPSSSSGVSEENTARFIGQPAVEEEIISRLMKIASENNVTIDWLLIRAIRLYIEDYKKTGRL